MSKTMAGFLGLTLWVPRGVGVLVLVPVTASAASARSIVQSPDTAVPPGRLNAVSCSGQGSDRAGGFGGVQNHDGVHSWEQWLPPLQK